MSHGGARPGAGRQPISTAARKTISVSLDPVLLDFVSREAEAAGVSRSTVVAFALETLQTRIAGSTFAPDYTATG